MKCIRCGKEMPADAKFCVECGYQFSQADQKTDTSGQGGYWKDGQYVRGTAPGPGTPNMNQPQKNGGCLKAILIGVGVIIGIGILVIGCDLLSGDDDDDKTKTASSQTASKDGKSDDKTSEKTDDESADVEKSELDTVKTDNGIYEFISECENIKYEELARNPDNYTGKKVMFWGRITQVLQEGDSYQYQVFNADTSNEDGFVFYDLPSGKSRILEDDFVAVFATYNGLMTYETTRGDERTVPKYSAKLVENIKDLRVIGTELAGMYGDYTSEDGGKLKIYMENGEYNVEINEDKNAVIKTYIMGINEDTNTLFCLNDKNLMDAVIALDNDKKQVCVVAGLEAGKANLFTMIKEDKSSDKDKDTETSEEQKTTEADTEEQETTTESNSGRSETVENAVSILENAVGDALDDGDIVYMTAVDTAKSKGGTWSINFDMQIFTDDERDAFSDQLVGKLGDSDRVTINFALQETRILININQDGTYTVTTPDVTASSSENSGYSEYYFEDSNSRYLTEDDLSKLSKDDLAYARNEIYARHGYIFQDPMFSKYFNSRTWYVPKYTGDEFDDSVFNDFEKKNIEFIKSHE